MTHLISSGGGMPFVGLATEATVTGFFREPCCARRIITYAFAE